VSRRSLGARLLWLLGTLRQRGLPASPERDSTSFGRSDMGRPA